MDCRTLVGFILLLIGTPSYQASSQKAVYGLRGRSILLSIEKSLLQGINVTSIIWKHKQDKAAEWFIGDTQPTYYRTFNSTATLDMNTWALNISNLQPPFDGLYSAEVNHVGIKDPVNLTVIDAEVYGVKGESITLPGQVPKSSVEYVQWSLNGSVIAEWDTKDRQTSSVLAKMEIDNKTFSLNISGLSLNCSGDYVFRTSINTRTFVYHLIIKDAILAVRISKRYNSSGCILTCTVPGKDDAQVTWTRSTGGDKPGPLLWVARTDNNNLTFTCRSPIMPSIIAKGISVKELFPNTFTEENPTTNFWYIAPIVLVVLLAVIFAIAVWKRGVIWRQCSRLPDEDNPTEMQDSAQQEAGPVANGAQPGPDAHLLPQPGDGGEGCAEEMV